MKHAGMLLAMAMLVTGCASSGTETKSTAAATAKPTFTEEEKANMTQEEKVAIHNATAEEEDQVICRREGITGSHKKRTVCRTVKQIQQDQDDARDSMKSATGAASGGN